MATGTLLPGPWLTALDDNGNPIAGAKIFTYAAGTTTKVSTYSDVALTTPNANPTIADAGGRVTMYLPPGISLKIVMSPANDTDPPTNPIKTADNISAIPSSSSNLDISGGAGEAIAAGQVVYLSDGSGGKTAGLWYLADADFTYASVLPEVGMATAAIASLATGTIRQAGQVTGLTGLVVGTTYYISATAGALTTTAPTNARFVGVADTTTSIVISPNPAYSSILQRTIRINATSPYSLTLPGSDAVGVLGSDGAGNVSYKTMYAVIAARAAAGTAAASTVYFGSAYESATETDSKFPIPVPGTVKNLYVQLDGTPGGSETFTFTVRKNGVDQTVTCVVSAAALTANDTTHSFTVVAGDLLSVKLVTSAGAATRKSLIAYTLVPS